MKSRLELCLNGLWDFCPDNGSLENIPGKWENTKIVVPSPWNINSFAGPRISDSANNMVFLRGGENNLFPQYPKEWENANSGWYRTEFHVPEEWKGNHIALCFNAVHFYSEYYINDILVSSDADGFPEFNSSLNQKLPSNS